MKVILQEGVSHLGEIGEVVSVKDGYARNYLFPRGLATPATATELALLESRKKKIMEIRGKALESAKTAASKLAGVKITISVKVSDEGQLYGSVGVTELSAALREKGFEIEKKAILIPEPIKKTGTFKVPVRFHADVDQEFEVEVVAEKAEA